MPRRVLHLGPYQPTLEEALLREVRGVRADDALRPILVLVPTAFLRQHLKRTLALALGGHSGIRFVTVSELARDIAERSLRSENLAKIPDAAATVLWRRAAAELPPDAFFGPIATTHGFPDALRSTIRDLKEAGLTPGVIQRRATGHSRLARKLRELAQVWARVEAAQNAAGFHDSLDMLHRAGEIAPEAPMLEGAATFVYGFYDLTRAQRKLVSGFLAGRVVAAVFLPYGPADADETFAYADATIDFFQGMEIFREDPDAPIPSKPIPPFEVIAAPGEGREAQEVARVVAHAPGALYETGVLLRASASQAPMIDEALEEAGLPRTIELTALREPAARAFRLMVEAKQLDLPRRHVIEILTTLPVRYRELLGDDAHGTAPGMWDVLSRDWGIVQGAEEWIARVDAGIGEIERVLGRAEREGEEEEARSAIGEAARGGARGKLQKAKALRKIIETLSLTLGNIPESGPWSEIARELRKAFETLFDFGEPGRAPMLPDGRPDPRADRWERVREALDEISRLDALASQSAALGHGTLAEAAELVEDALGDGRVRAGTLEGKGALVADLMKARGLPFRTVVVPGMIEGVFPRIARPDPLLGDSERVSLNKVFDANDAPFDESEEGADASLGPDGPIPLKGASTREERLLFRLCLDAAREKVVFTLPRLDPATARDRIPSWLLMRLVEGPRAEGQSAITVEQFASRVSWLPLDPAPVDRARSLTRLELDLADLAATLSPGLDDASRARKAASLVARTPFGRGSIAAENARWGSREYTAWDGWLTPPANAPGAWIEALASISFRARGEVSASRLETWATCPYKYFLQYGLGLSALEEPERTMTLEPTDRGEIIHRALERFWRGERDAGRLPIPEGATAEAVSRMETIANAVLDEFAARGVTGPAVLWRAARREILGDLRETVRRAVTEDAGWIPRELELSFGTMPAEPGTKSAGAVTLAGTELGFRGRIDRVDVSTDGSKGRVVDYKSGRVPPKPKKPAADGDDQAPLFPPIFQGGQQLQRPLYVLAARNAFPDVREWQAVYDYCTQRGGFEKDQVPVDDATLDRLSKLVAAMSADAEAGRYPFVPDVDRQCKWCDFRPVCGPGHEIAHAAKKDFEPLVKLLRKKEEYQ